jgi:hypothetical protein
MRGISRLAEKLLASQDGLFSMQLRRLTFVCVISYVRLLSPALGIQLVPIVGTDQLVCLRK